MRIHNQGNDDLPTCLLSGACFQHEDVDNDDDDDHNDNDNDDVDNDGDYVDNDDNDNDDDVNLPAEGNVIVPETVENQAQTYHHHRPGLSSI